MNSSGRIMGLVTIIAVAFLGFYLTSSFREGQSRTAAEAPPTVAPLETPTPVQAGAVLSIEATSLSGWKTTSDTFEDVSYELKLPPGWSPSGSCPAPTGTSFSAPPPGCVMLEVIAGQKARDIGSDLNSGQPAKISGYAARKSTRTLPSGPPGQTVYTILVFNEDDTPFWGLVAYISAGTDQNTTAALTTTIEQIADTVSLKKP